MIPAFCLRVLLLAAIGQHATGNAANYKSKTINPQSEQRETAPRRFTPPSSGYRSYLQPGTYFPSPKVSEWPSFKSPVQTSRLEQRGSNARQVDSYSQPGSVSSYRPASHPLKPAQSLQQPHSRIYQASSAPWDSLSPQSENKFGSRIVSSGAVEFHAGPKSVHQEHPVSGERYPGSNVPPRYAAGASNIMPPQKAEGSPAGVLQTQDDMWNLPQSLSGFSQSRPTMTHSNAMPSQRRASSQSSSVLQSKEGMLNIGSPQSPGGVGQSASDPRSDEYKKPTQRLESSQSSGALQPKEGMWKLPQTGLAPRRETTVHSNVGSSQNVASPTSALQTKEKTWQMPQSQSRTAVHSNTKPVQRQPSSPSVLQTKEGIWSLPGSYLPNPGIEARRFRPTGLERKVQTSTQSQQQPSLSRKPAQQTFSQVPSVQTKGQMAAPRSGSGITGHATVSYSSNPPRGRSAQSSPTKTVAWDRSGSNQKTRGASGMASLTSLYQFDGDRPKLLPSLKKTKASS